MRALFVALLALTAAALLVWAFSLASGVPLPPTPVLPVAIVATPQPTAYATVLVPIPVERPATVEVTVIVNPHGDETVTAIARIWNATATVLARMPPPTETASATATAVWPNDAGAGVETT